MEDNAAKSYLYESLGKTLVAFQSLEKAIERMIFTLMTSDHTQVSIMMSEVSFKAKLNIMRSLVKNEFTSENEVIEIGNIFDAIDKIISDCHNCEGRRNQLIHSFWVPGFKSTPELMMRIKNTAKSKNGYKYNVETISEGSLDNDIEAMDDLAKMLNMLSFKIAHQYEFYHGIHGLENSLDKTLLREQIKKNVINYK